MKVVWMKAPRVSGRSLAQILGRAFWLSARDLPGWWMRAVRSCVCNSRAAVLWTVVFCSLAALTGSVAASENSKTSMADPLIAVHDGFVDEKTCSSCHADQAAAFAKSHHAKAMTVADDKSVLGNFNNIQFDRDGVAASFSAGTIASLSAPKGQTASRRTTKSNIRSPMSLSSSI